MKIDDSRIIPMTPDNSKVKPLYIDSEAPLEDFSQRKWITKEEALKMWPDRTESTLDCTNAKCRCKTRKKENEGL